MKKIMSMLFIAFAIAVLLVVVKLTILNGISGFVLAPFAVISTVMIYISLSIIVEVNNR